MASASCVASDAMIMLYLTVALQRPRGRQRLELAGEQCAVGHRLSQSHRHCKVEHLR